MENKYGRARFDGKALHFDAVGWAMIKVVAKHKKKSPTQVVTAALLRAAKAGVFSEKSKNA